MGGVSDIGPAATARARLGNPGPRTLCWPIGHVIKCVDTGGITEATMWQSACFCRPQVSLEHDQDEESQGHQARTGRV
eukprot:2789966-Amphidinium_carterae.1